MVSVLAGKAKRKKNGDDEAQDEAEELSPLDFRPSLSANMGGLIGMMDILSQEITPVEAQQEPTIIQQEPSIFFEATTPARPTSARAITAFSEKLAPRNQLQKAVVWQTILDKPVGLR
ncbi:MAG: hypothetical protein A2Y14_01785 [Verrucomicrobia bacterium GWF2_51_19]|nr:MAG: hypothetical protein A2Y14_01785 [Verrucomicrobia bacterium GWF2_51_19]